MGDGQYSKDHIKVSVWSCVKQKQKNFHTDYVLASSKLTYEIAMDSDPD